MNTFMNTTPKTLLAFDPGSFETRYCILRGDAKDQRYIQKGHISSSPRALAQFVNDHPADAYAVEITGSYQPDPRKVLSLLKCAEVAGTLIGLIAAQDKPCFTMPANAPKGKHSWRVLLCGQRDGARANDATVQQYLKLILPDFPHSKSNEHERDAAGLGVVALRCNLKTPAQYEAELIARAQAGGRV
jgi:Holliday junction resolvasome RuvABC endonuclease subunit